uniref:Clp R domain-containing protein n=1 Tax=Haptolina brevifila TaxID=156173 RepID=A0A7S2ILD5_9EUKA
MEAFSFDPFDREVFRILMDAQSEARVLGAGAVGTQHLMLAATLQKDDVQASLASVGVTSDAVRTQLRSGGQSSNVPGLDRLFAATAKDELLPFGKDTERALKASVQQSKLDGGALSRDQLVTWRELMLAVLGDNDSSAKQVLANMNVPVEIVYQAVMKGERELVGAGGGKGQNANTTLAKCSTDLTAQARAGKLDPVVGREEEVKRCMQILVRRRKNNPVLIGDPGVGKTAIAEGLAQVIVDGKAPPRLANARILSLELGLLVADTKYRGEFEQRLREVIDEVTKSPDTILFIDELHTLVGAGAAEGAIDAANLLKPALARGELQCIGATTVTEYRKYIEKDAALERRFQPVNVPEPSLDQTIAILSTLQPRYEEHHNVTYQPEALQAAAKLAERYITDRFLPDKAIDLMDEAGAIAQMEAFESGGTESMRAVDEEVVAQVVASWTGIPLAKLTADEASAMLNLEEELHRRVIGQHGAVSAISRALRRAKVGLRAPRRPVASMIFCGPTGVGKTELAKAVASLYYGQEKAMVRLDMSEYMEAHSVSRLTGPPPGYVGYDAGGQLTEAVRRTPHTVILLDEVEKAHPDVFNILLQVLEDGRLTDNKGRTVDFSNAMLILTSNVGSRRILQMAKDELMGVGGSGAAAKNVKANGVGETEEREASYRRMRSAVKAELGNAFRPEFLNRLDEVIVFESLRPSEVTTIAGLMLNDLAARCEENEVSLSWTPELAQAVVRSGFSASFGARPLRRAVQRLCEDSVAEALLGGFVVAGDTLTVDAEDGDVVLRNPQGETKVHVASAGQGIEEDEAAQASFDAALLAEGTAPRPSGAVV